MRNQRHETVAVELVSRCDTHEPAIVKDEDALGKAQHLVEVGARKQDAEPLIRQ
jgi:hypothetical protein